MYLPIFLPEMLLYMLTLRFGMTLLLSFKPGYVLMLLFHNAKFGFDIKKKKDHNIRTIRFCQKKKNPLLIMYFLHLRLFTI